LVKLLACKTHALNITNWIVEPDSQKREEVVDLFSLPVHMLPA
jgi:hypothetical protein